MKKYTSPKIVSISLNSEQAILQVCQVAGAYFDNLKCTLLSSRYAGYGTCYISVRGTRGFQMVDPLLSPTSGQPS